MGTLGRALVSAGKAIVTECARVVIQARGKAIIMSAVAPDETLFA